MLFRSLESTLPGKLDQQSATTAVLDFNQIELPITVRTIQDGDQFQPFGCDYLKSVNRFCMDKKIPKSRRNQLPVVFSGDRVIWIAGIQIDDRVKVTASTRTVLKIEMEPVHV